MRKPICIMKFTVQWDSPRVKSMPWFDHYSYQDEPVKKSGCSFGRLSFHLRAYSD